MIGPFPLLDGPSSELLFDCLRLGGRVKQLRRLFFASELSIEGCAPTHWHLVIPIEGILQDGDNDVAWFFFGQLDEDQDDLSPVPIPGSPKGRYLFGRWNTQLKRGSFVLDDTPFFKNPL